LAQGIPATRRAAGGARREISSRVKLLGLDGVEFDGWALNISRGGIRVVIEERVELGQIFNVTDLDPDVTEGRFRARVVWVQDEPDGSVVGMEFVDEEGKRLSDRPLTGPPIAASAPPPPPPPEISLVESDQPFAAVSAAVAKPPASATEPSGAQQAQPPAKPQEPER